MRAAQFIFAIIPAFFIVKVYLEYFARKRSIRELIAWTFVWGGMLLVIMVPISFKHATSYVRISSGAEILFLTSIIILFYLVLQIFIKIENLNRDLTVVVRKEALKRFFAGKKGMNEEKD